MFKVSSKIIRGLSWSQSKYKTIFLQKDEHLVAYVTLVFGVVCRAFVRVHKRVERVFCACCPMTSPVVLCPTPSLAF
jgi:hypothetical protein